MGSAGGRPRDTLAASGDSGSLIWEKKQGSASNLRGNPGAIHAECAIGQVTLPVLPATSSSTN